MDIKLSIVIPTYNRAERLKKSLECYTKNKRCDVEFVVVDNASLDATREVVDNMMKSDQRIRYMRNSQNLGFNRNLYRGCLEAKAKYITILPDDDFVTEGFYDLVIDVMEKYPKVGVIHSHLMSSNIVSERNIAEDKYVISEAGYNAINSIFMLSGAIQGLTFRKKAIDFKVWKLDSGVYPQVQVSCQAALIWDVCVVHSRSEYVIVGELDNIEVRVSDAMNRPNDYGIIERIDILESISKQLPKRIARRVFQENLSVLLMWGFACVQELFNYNKKKSDKLLLSILSDKRAKANVVFTYTLLKNGYLNILKYFPTLLLIPYFWSSAIFYVGKLSARFIKAR